MDLEEGKWVIYKLIELEDSRFFFLIGYKILKYVIFCFEIVFEDSKGKINVIWGKKLYKLLSRNIFFYSL